MKFARLDPAGQMLAVAQRPCALWQGLETLEALLCELTRDTPANGAMHAVTMTGELCDLFASRAEGVRAILETLSRHLPGALAVFSSRGFLSVPEACASPLDVGSMNWLATASDAARYLPHGVLLDIGSTTTDLVPFAGGLAQARADQDGARLASGELLYTGLSRTPVMAVARRAPFGGSWRGLAAEHFATMADVYRLLGELPAGMDVDPTADGRPADVVHSRARLARMLGEDSSRISATALCEFARFLARRQSESIEQALAQVVGTRTENAPFPSFVGAGIGTLLAARIARAWGAEFLTYAELGGGSPHAGVDACAPAVAVARLLQAGGV